MRPPWFHLTGPATVHDLALAQWWEERRAELDAKAAEHHEARKPEGHEEPAASPARKPSPGGRHRGRP